MNSSKTFSWPQAQAFDKKNIWHPYTSMVNPLPTFPVISAQSVELTLATGEVLIDAMSSWWSVIHGYRHPKIDAALIEQSKQFSHVMFGGLTHEPAVTLAKKLIEITPEKLTKVFLADSGSVAVEVAIKMATQYWYAKGQAHKNKLLTVKGGYHGDTAACMSVCDPETGMHEMFTGILPQQKFAPRPACKFNDVFEEVHIADLKALLEQHHQNIAAVIIEPIVQGAGGMYFYAPAYLKRLRELCNEFSCLLILDEIATGFGRTGKLFACEFADVQADIMCVGKALTGGYMSLAATLTTDEVALGISGDGSGALMHGPTFMGNALACACANASIDVLFENHWQQQVNNIENILLQQLLELSALPHVEEVRVLGAIGVVELKQAVNMEKITRAFIQQGVWFRPFGKLVYTMPPYVISEAQLGKLCAALKQVLHTPDEVF